MVGTQGDGQRSGRAARDPQAVGVVEAQVGAVTEVERDIKRSAFTWLNEQTDM